MTATSYHSTQVSRGPARRYRSGLFEIVERMKARDGIDGLILGGTELPLILRAQEHAGVRFLDTTKLHVDAIVDRLLS
jgi:aspartate racemase